MHYVYLLHFDAPLEHNQHYIGSALDLARRLDQHASAHGAQLTRRFARAGISFRVGGLWTYGSHIEAVQAERRLKRSASAKRCCFCVATNRA